MTGDDLFPAECIRNRTFRAGDDRTSITLTLKANPGEEWQRVVLELVSGLAEGTALEQDRQLAHKLLDTAMDGPKADWKIPLTLHLPAQPGAARLLQHLANGCDRWEIFQKNTNTASALREWTGITGDPVGKEILGQMYEMGIRVRAVPIFAYLQAAVQRLALEVF